MKKILLAITSLMCFMCLFAGCAKEPSIVGKWIDDKTEAMFEYTSDGYYYEYANESFTSIKTKYIVKNGEIIYYLEDSSPDEGTAVPYEINDEGNLVIGGEVEYRPLKNPTKEEQK